jgi:Bacterial Ig-like domain (group 2)
MRSLIGTRGGCLLCAAVAGCASPPTEAGFSDGAAQASATVVPSISISGGAIVPVGGCTRYTSYTSGFSGYVSIDWHTSDPRVATVRGRDPDFRYADVCGVSDGFAAIHATAEGRSGGLTHNVVSNSVAVEVGQPIRSVRITPNPISVKPGATVQLTAATVDQYGHTRNTAASWTSSKPAVATVSSSGLARGVAPGTAIISATYKGYTGTASLTTGISGVTISGPASISAPGSYQFTASVIPSGTYHYVWHIITYGNNQHFTRTGNPLSLLISRETGAASMHVRIYQNGVHLGSSGTKVVGNGIGGGGGCTGKKC